MGLQSPLNRYHPGDMVRVGLAYRIGGTFERDAWTGLTMLVVKVNGMACHLSRGAGQEPEVWLDAGRLSRAPKAPKP